MILRLLIVLELALLPCAASAQNYGLGVRSCAQFAQDYQKDPAMEDVYFVWAGGFLSGLSLQALVAKMAFGQPEGGDHAMASYKQTIRTYCDQHPLQSYASAVLALYGTLPIAPKNSN